MKLRSKLNSATVRPACKNHRMTIADSHAAVFCTCLFAVIKGKHSPQPQLAGGDAFSMEVTQSRRFGSSGLSLAFEGLL
jgi:hypothetical protein